MSVVLFLRLNIIQSDRYTYLNVLVEVTNILLNNTRFDDTLTASSRTRSEVSVSADPKNGKTTRSSRSSS